MTGLKARDRDESARGVGGARTRRPTTVRWLFAVAVALPMPAVGAQPADRPVAVPPEAVEALRRQDFAGALAIVDDALAASSGAAAPGDPGALTLRVVRAQACYGLGRLDDAVAALEPFQAVAGDDAPLVSARVDWSARTVLGDCLMARGEWAEALLALERALACVDLQDKVPGEGATTEAARGRAIDRATTLAKIGTVKARLADWEGARAAFVESEAALAGEPDGGGVFRAAARNGLGLVADNTGDHAAAARHYAEAARIYEATFGVDHPYTKRALVTLHRVQGKLGNEREVAAIAEKLAATGTDVEAPLPATLPVGPQDDALAPRFGLPGWPVVAAIVAAGLLAWMLAGGRRGRGDTATDSGAGPRAGDPDDGVDPDAR